MLSFNGQVQSEWHMHILNNYYVVNTMVLPLYPTITILVCNILDSTLFMDYFFFVEFSVCWPVLSSMFCKCTIDDWKELLCYQHNLMTVIREIWIAILCHIHVSYSKVLVDNFILFSWNREKMCLFHF